jgi:hypothetical protein
MREKTRNALLTITREDFDRLDTMQVARIAQLIGLSGRMVTEPAERAYVWAKILTWRVTR